MLLTFGTPKSRNMRVFVWNWMVIHRLKHYFFNRVREHVLCDWQFVRAGFNGLSLVQMLLINVNNSNRLCPDRTKRYKTREQRIASTANCPAFGPLKCLVIRPIFVLVCMNRSDEKTHLLYILLSNPRIRDKMGLAVIKSGSRDRLSNPGLSRRKRDGWQQTWKWGCGPGRGVTINKCTWQ